MFKPSRIHFDLKKKAYRDWVQFLTDSEKWTKEEVETYQLNKLKEIINFAETNILGYKKLFQDASVSGSDLKKKEDIAKFPFTTKETFRDHLDQFSIQTKRTQYITTGGSTGIPFGFYRNNDAFYKELATKAYQYYRVGWKEGARQMVFRGLVINSKSKIKFYPKFNELRCSSYDLTDDLMEKYRKVAFEYKPQWIKSYPSSLYIFAKFLEETGRSFPKLKGILCASENLYDYQKELFEKVFKTKVFSHYGHYELATIAAFCETEDTYHVLPQYGYAELIGKDGKSVTKIGEVGEIVATSFIMRSTPFIRYRTRDLAVFGGFGCPKCKRPYQIWKKIEGRLQEFIITKTGRFISMAAMNMHDDIFDHIKQFQFYQDTKGKVIFNFIPKDSCTNKIIEQMKKRLEFKLGTDIELTMEIVDNIPYTKRGKFRFLIQKLDLPYGDES